MISFSNYDIFIKVILEMIQFKILKLVIKGRQETMIEIYSLENEWSHVNEMIKKEKSII